MSVKNVILTMVTFSLLTGCQYFRDGDSYAEGIHKQVKTTKTMSWPKGLNSAKFSNEYDIPKTGNSLKPQNDSPYPPSLDI